MHLGKNPHEAEDNVERNGALVHPRGLVDEGAITDRIMLQYIVVLFIMGHAWKSGTRFEYIIVVVVRYSGETKS